MLATNSCLLPININPENGTIIGAGYMIPDVIIKSVIL